MKINKQIDCDNDSNDNKALYKFQIPFCKLQIPFSTSKPSLSSNYGKSNLPYFPIMQIFLATMKYTSYVKQGLIINPWCEVDNGGQKNMQEQGRNRLRCGRDGHTTVRAGMNFLCQ